MLHKEINQYLYDAMVTLVVLDLYFISDRKHTPWVKEVVTLILMLIIASTFYHRVL